VASRPSGCCQLQALRSEVVDYNRHKVQAAAHGNYQRMAAEKLVSVVAVADKPVADSLLIAVPVVVEPGWPLEHSVAVEATLLVPASIGCSVASASICGCHRRFQR